MNGRRRVALRAVRDGSIVAGLLFTAYLFLIVAPKQGTVGFDAYAYWAVDPSNPYVVAPGGLGAFNYAPPIAWICGFFGHLEWFTFLWLWLALLLGTVIFLGRRGYRVIWLLAFPPVALDLYHGNIDLLIAAAVVLGFRYPWTWGFILLTKVTPGVGLLWFAVRREWRSLAIALGVTGVIVAVSVIANPQLWQDWFTFLRSAQSGVTVVAPGGRCRPGDLGRAHESSVDGRPGRHDRSAHPVAEWLRHLRRAGALGDAPGRRARRIDFAGCRTP